MRRGETRTLDSTVMLRPALLEDIPAMHALRLAVRENRLSDPSRVTQADYERRLAKPGASWVAELNGSIAGFAIADFPSRSVWALFVNPGFEGRGIGRSLLQQITQSLEAAGPGTIHLSTEGGTRAERLYAAAGWTRLGQLPNGELHFVRVVPGAA
jgi:ribosomal protein S18 acetylase RimI-like enzyme